MNARPQRGCTAFEGFHLIASGGLADVAIQTKAVIDRGERAPILIFDDVTSELVEVDFRGNSQDMLGKLVTSASQGQLTAAQSDSDRSRRHGPGRPRLGVVAREITLLPRHWDWLNRQPGGASVALRKVIDEARRLNQNKDRVRQSIEVAYRFISAIAGNLPGFEEATRALFATNAVRFDELIESWPVDVRDHAKKLTATAFQRQKLVS